MPLLSERERPLYTHTSSLYPKYMQVGVILRHCCTIHALRRGYFFKALHGLFVIDEKTKMLKTQSKIPTESKVMQVLKLCKLAYKPRPHYCFMIIFWAYMLKRTISVRQFIIWFTSCIRTTPRFYLMFKNVFILTCLFGGIILS